MSYIEDEFYFGLEDLAYEFELEKERQYQHNLDEHIWIGAGNRRYIIEYMTTQHIKNCMHMIYKKNGTWRHEYLQLFQNELLRRKWQNGLYSL